MAATRVLRNWVLAPPLQAELPTLEVQPPIPVQRLLEVLGLDRRRAREEAPRLGMPLA